MVFLVGLLVVWGTILNIPNAGECLHSFSNSTSRGRWTPRRKAEIEKALPLPPLLLNMLLPPTTLLRCPTLLRVLKSAPILRLLLLPPPFRPLPLMMLRVALPPDRRRRRRRRRDSRCRISNNGEHQHRLHRRRRRRQQHQQHQQHQYRR